MKRKLALLFLIVSFSCGLIRAQSPAVVVQAATPTPATAAPPTAVDSDSFSILIKLLKEMKATNAETLKKQEAVLQQIDDIQKAAEQMKAFSKRS